MLNTIYNALVDTLQDISQQSQSRIELAVLNNPGLSTAATMIVGYEVYSAFKAIKNIFNEYKKNKKDTPIKEGRKPLVRDDAKGCWDIEYERARRENHYKDIGEQIFAIQQEYEVPEELLFLIIKYVATSHPKVYYHCACAEQLDDPRLFSRFTDFGEKGGSIMFFSTEYGTASKLKNQFLSDGWNEAKQQHQQKLAWQEIASNPELLKQAELDRDEIEGSQQRYEEYLENGEWDFGI